MIAEKLRDTAKRRLAALLRVFPVSTVQNQATMKDVWLPSDGEPIVLLRWLFSEWCNYRCPYCPQTHSRHEAKGSGMTAHAFDNFPIDQWISAFDRHFSHHRLSMVMTGGESMLDRKSMMKLLNHLSSKKNVECIRIDTNAWWKPEQFPDLDTSKIILMCTFHPSQTTEDQFLDRVRSYGAAGYEIGMVNYVMNEANVAEFTRRRDALADIGLALHPNPLWGSNGVYAEDDLALMKQVLPEFDFGYRSGAVNPIGKSCYFPALSYEMDLAGTIHVGCQPELTGSFFDDALPTRPDDSVACPYDSCVCLDKYSFLDGFERNISANPLAEYSKALRARRSETESLKR